MGLFSSRKTTSPQMPDVRHVEIEESENTLKIRYRPQRHFSSFLGDCITLLFIAVLLWIGWWFFGRGLSAFLLKGKDLDGHDLKGMAAVIFVAICAIMLFIIISRSITLFRELFSSGTEWDIHINADTVQLEWRCGKISGFLLSLLHVNTTKFVQFDRKDIVGGVNKNGVWPAIYNGLSLKKWRDSWFVSEVTYSAGMGGHFQLQNGTLHFLPVIVAPGDKSHHFCRWLIHKINDFLETHPA